MSKLHAPKVTEKSEDLPFALPEQVGVPLHQLAGAVKEGLLAFSAGVGLQVMALMMEEELGDVVGPAVDCLFVEIAGLRDLALRLSEDCLAGQYAVDIARRGDLDAPHELFSPV